MWLHEFYLKQFLVYNTHQVFEVEIELVTFSILP
jgi:hypothetical protein